MDIKIKFSNIKQHIVIGLCKTQRLHSHRNAQSQRQMSIELEMILLSMQINFIFQIQNLAIFTINDICIIYLNAIAVMSLYVGLKSNDFFL